MRDGALIGNGHWSMRNHLRENLLMPGKAFIIFRAEQLTSRGVEVDLYIYELVLPDSARMRVTGARDDALIPFLYFSSLHFDSRNFPNLSRRSPDRHNVPPHTLLELEITERDLCT